MNLFLAIKMMFSNSGAAEVTKVGIFAVLPLAGYALHRMFEADKPVSPPVTAWNTIAQKMGGELRNQSEPIRMDIPNSGAPFQILAERHLISKDWRIRVREPAQVPFRFYLHPRSGEHRAHLESSEQFIRTGDKRFDSALTIHGKDEAAVVALFSQEVRMRLLAFFEGNNRIVTPEGLELYENSERVLAGTERMISLLKEAMSVFEILKIQDSEILAHFATKLANDPDVNIRLHSLSTLINRFSRAEKTAVAMKAAMTDPDPMIRLRAAFYFNPKNIDSAVNDVLKPPVKHYPDNEMKTLIDLLTIKGGPAAERALLHWASFAVPSVRRKAVEGLGQLGTSHTLGRLHALNGDAEFREIVNKAIAQIQSRIDPSDRGALSLSQLEGAVGDLSLAQEGGELSLEEKPSPKPE